MFRPRMRALKTILILSGMLVSQREARAWLDLCNRTSSEVRSTFAYLDTNDNRNAAFNNGWVAEGWYVIKPGACARVYPHELWRRNQYYYFYAEGGGGTWPGDSPFCVSRGRFTIGQNQAVKDQCANGRVVYSYQPRSQGCGGYDSCIAVMPPRVTVRLEQTYWLRFRKIDIGSGRRQNHTVNLN